MKGKFFKKMYMASLRVFLWIVFIFFLSGALYGLSNITEIKEWGLWGFFVLVVFILGYPLIYRPLKTHLEITNKNKVKNIEQGKTQLTDTFKSKSMKTLYKWQKITLWIIGILTFIAVTVNTLGKEFNFGYFLDLIIAIGMNILILWLLFQLGNWTYRSLKHSKSKEEAKNNYERKNRNNT